MVIGRGNPALIVIGRGNPAPTAKIESSTRRDVISHGFLTPIVYHARERGR